MIYEIIQKDGLETIHMKDSLREVYLTKAQQISLSLIENGVQKDLKIFSQSEEDKAEQTADFWMMRWL